MSTITVKDGTNPMWPLDYELEGLTLSPLIRCPYSNETPRNHRKKAKFSTPVGPRIWVESPKTAELFRHHLGEN
jgi:hypothetical protein